MKAKSDVLQTSVRALVNSDSLDQLSTSSLYVDSTAMSP